MKRQRITRREVRAWLAPIRSAFAEMRTGEVDAIRGYPVTRLHHSDDYARIDYCIAGWRGCVGRLFPGSDLSALERVEKKLDAGTPLTLAEIDESLRTLNRFEDLMTGLTRAAVKAAVLTEQIAIELETAA